MQNRMPFRAPLDNHPLFASSSIDEAREFVGNVFCPHQLTPAKKVTAIDAQMHHLKVSNQSSLNFLRYGNRVDVKPGAIEKFFNVQIQLTGSVVTQCGRQIETINAGDAGVLSPTEFSSMRWSRNASMLIFRVDRDLMERKLRAVLSSHLDEPLVFDAKLNHHTSQGASWIRAVQFLIDELEAESNFFKLPNAIESFEENLILSLLYGQPHNYSGTLVDGKSKAAPAHVKRVEDYIHANAGDSISIEELASISKVSARALFSAFKQFRGTSPMKYLRRVRLSNVRRALSNPNDTRNITEIASSSGFTQLGRFAAEYHRVYGEVPSATVKRVR